MDASGIADALAASYAGLTPPTGYDAIRVATAELPNQMVPLPAVLVFADSGDVATKGNASMVGVSTWTIRFYYDQTGDLPRAQRALLKWLAVLLTAHRTGIQLGGRADVTRTSSWRIGRMTYADTDYVGIELTVMVTTTEAWTPTA